MKRQVWLLGLSGFARVVVKKRRMYWTRHQLRRELRLSGSMCTALLSCAVVQDPSAMSSRSASGRELTSAAAPVRTLLFRAARPDRPPEAPALLRPPPRPWDRVSNRSCRHSPSTSLRLAAVVDGAGAKVTTGVLPLAPPLLARCCRPPASVILNDAGADVPRPRWMTTFGALAAALTAPWSITCTPWSPLHVDLALLSADHSSSSSASACSSNLSCAHIPAAALAAVDTGARAARLMPADVFETPVKGTLRAAACLIRPTAAWPPISFLVAAFRLAAPVNTPLRLTPVKVCRPLRPTFTIY
jgi:hypothetical protein|eukprot:COSAG03_NODE_2833_length_2423_cov_2.014200_2_plen_302_part_00